MPHMELKVTGTKFTSREGDDPDDLEYQEQIRLQIESDLKALGFVRVEVGVRFTD